MAEKNVVVEETVEVKAEEQKPVEMTAPATPAKNAEPAPQLAPDKPEADKSEPPKTETKKSTKKAAKKKSAPKDKSEKDESAPQPAPKKGGKKFVAIKKDAEKSPVETSARDKMFPVEFEVNGIKFRRIELTAQKDESGKSLGFMPSIIDAKNDEPDGCVLCLAFQWSEDMLAPTGKKGIGKSLYEKYSGVTPPAKFPCDLEMCLIDAILNVRLEQIISHSLYTENPGYTNFEVFDKRTKEGWFDCNNAPVEVYLADFHEFDFSNGMFVNLYNK